MVPITSRSVPSAAGGGSLARGREAARATKRDRWGRISGDPSRRSCVRLTSKERKARTHGVAVTYVSNLLDMSAAAGTKVRTPKPGIVARGPG